jgi:hypothetical protein
MVIEYFQVLSSEADCTSYEVEWALLAFYKESEIIFIFQANSYSWNSTLHQTGIINIPEKVTRSIIRRLTF